MGIPKQWQQTTPGCMNNLSPNIVVINDFAYVNGGAAQVALTSSLALANRGYSVILITAVAPIMPELNHPNLKIYCTNQYEIIKDPSKLRAAVQGLWNPRARKLMEQVLDSLDPENTVIHLHAWTKSLSSSVVRVALQKHFKIVCTLHDYFLACPNGGFFNYQKNAICTLKPMSLHCICTDCDARSYSQKLWRCVRQVIQRKCADIPSAIKHYIAVSDFSLEVLRPFLPRNKTIYRINNPIDISKQNKVKVARNNNYVCVGRLAKEKGVVLFANSAKKLNINAIFIGDGECRNEILGAYDKATVLGWVSREKIVELLQTARVLVLPSLWYETQGLVVLEAAALGIPTIVPDTSAAREFVVDGETGLWFKSGCSDDLAEKISILSDDETAASMGEKAYNHYWHNSFSMENHVDQLVKCYSEVLVSVKS